MSEPKPKQSGTTRPAAQQPSVKEEAARPESSAVIYKSYRVLELPPPPVDAPPRANKAEPSEASRHDTLPDDLAAPAETRLQTPIELDALQIRTHGQWGFLHRRVRIPPRWEQWLADPQRRNKIGVGSSIAIHVAIIVLLALVLHSPARIPTDLIHARTVQPASGETASAMQEPIKPLREPLVRQVTAGALESIAIEPPEEMESEIPDLNAKHGEKQAKEQVPKIEPPGKLAVESGGAGLEAHPAVTSPAEEPLPGMADGSQVPPDLLRAIDALMKDKFHRRTPSGRIEGVSYTGGTPQSEEAVERALHWLAIHQRVDGSWNFDHRSEACLHYCTHPGSEGSTTAATALALLPFLGAGYTHKVGDFQSLVERGLDYVKRRGIKISYGNDLRDGSMYGHALATIALCEAYGMTRDEDLKEAAQGALDYIAYVQDGNTGGWRYNPGEAGDTTVTGWMIMALKSGQMARLNVQSPAILAAQRFLDSVQNQDGSQYGYQSRQPQPTTTAVGLLCRMYTGWRRDNPRLVKGVAYLSAQGPSPDTLYYDYYATQVLFHWAGPEWDHWNHKMRERLISMQERQGHPSGSWYFESKQSAAGGRLYNTAMATMILEVYYRFMPLYGEGAVDGK